MEKAKKHPKTHYRQKLLQEFKSLKSEEAMLEVLEYTRFVREEERELEKLTLKNKSSSKSN